jgi:MoxR-like ATPase
MTNPASILAQVKAEISKIVIGNETLVEHLLIALLSRGHVLLIGPPGMAKTTLVHSFADSLHLPFNRIQFTPDLMPSDILGNEILQENKTTGQRELSFIKGPIFTQILLADEINRTPPKTQAALLQAMQEKTVTLFGRTEKLAEPFMVLATQNPIEQEGTYPLPEAQLDRFLFSLYLDYPSYENELAIVKRHSMAILEKVNAVLSGEAILELQKAVYAMTVSDHVYEKAVKLTRATRPEGPEGPDGENPLPEVRKFVKWGAGPRAVQFLVLAAKAKALLDGRPTPTESDVTALFKAAMNHRLQLNFQAEAEGVTVDTILDIVLKSA